MVNRIILKKSTVAAKVPLAADMEIGELAINTADAKLYTKHSDGTVKALSNAADSTKLPLAGGTMTGAIDFAAGQTWPTFNQNTTGNAATATKLATSVSINGVGFDGSANITINAVDSTARVAAAGGTASGLTLNDGYTEEVFTVTGTTPALSPTSGSIQTWTLTGTSTPTLGVWASGQSMTLLIDDGAAYTVNWASMGVVWKTGGGAAPTLLATGYTVLVLVKVGSTLYGWLAGNA